MPHITERRRKDGSIAYLAQIAIKRNGKWEHREARTFDKKSAANAWLKKRMSEIDAAGGDLSSIRNRGQKLSDAINRYLSESLKQIGRTKAQVLNTILEYDIADMACSEIQSHDIVAFAKELSADKLYPVSVH